VLKALLYLFFTSLLTVIILNYYSARIIAVLLCYSATFCSGMVLQHDNATVLIVVKSTVIVVLYCMFYGLIVVHYCNDVVQHFFFYIALWMLSRTNAALQHCKDVQDCSALNISPYHY
jgi:hypothetical protein